MAKIHLMGTAIVAAALIAGCNKNETQETAASLEPGKDANEAMVVVNGETLTRGQIAADVEKIIAYQGDKIPAEQMEYARRMFANQIAQTFIAESVLAKKAAELGYTVTDEDIKARETEFLKSVAGSPDAPKSIEEAAEKSPLGKDRTMKEFKTGILIDKMLKAEALAKNTKDYTAEAQKIVDNIVSNNALVANSEAEALKKITDIKAILDATPDADKAAKFGELAEEKSDCPSGKRAKGDLDFFTHGQMVKEFDEAAFALPVGKISDIVKTSFGYHLILVTDKKTAVEPKDDQPGEPEKVRASHILCKIASAQPVPALEDVVNYIKKGDERQIVGKFIEDMIRGAKIEAADEYKNLLPPEEPAAAPVEVPVETPAEK